MPARRPGKPRPPKPDLPESAPRLPGPAYREIKATARSGEFQDVVRAVGAAGVALDSGEVDEAVRLLVWAKSAASRSASVREALGIALYAAGDFEGAHRELVTYRRLTDRVDQNHLLADCARALGKPEKVREYVQQLLNADEVHPERAVEGLIVLASDRADRGDLVGAMGILEKAELSPKVVRDYHPRLWYVAGDIAERMGDSSRARELFAAVAAIADDFLDVEERLERLGE